MVFKTYGENKYAISDSLKVINTTTGVEINKDSDRVVVSIFGIEKEVKKEWLYYLSKYRPNINPEYKECVFDLEFIKRKDEGISIIFKKPYHYKHNTSFRLIASDPTLAINKNGNVLNTETGKHLCVVWCRYPYIRYELKQLKIHRLVALTWIKNDDWYNNIVVDHIDGNTHNFKSDNLRWLSYKLNHQVSLRQGNREENLVVITRNIDSGEVTEHASLVKACEYMGRSRITTKVTDLEPGRVWKGIYGRFEIKLANDNTDWAYAENKENMRKQPNHNKSRVLFIYNNATTLYNSIEEAAKALLDVKIENTREGLTKKLQAKYPGCVVAIEDKSYQAKNMRTGEVITCKTIGELCSKLGDEFKKSTIRTYIACNKTHNSYIFRETPFPYTDVWVQGEDSKEASNASMTIKATNIETGVELRFGSLRALARYYGVNKNTVRHYLISRRLFNNKIKLELSPID